MVKSPAKLQRQMAERGWTAAQVDEARASGMQYATTNLETGGPGTRYGHPITGRLVIIDDERAGCSMSGATVSTTETIYVRLLDEGVNVWRPVPAVPLGAGVFRLGNDRMPEEIWEFPPGSSVLAVAETLSDGIRLVAVTAAGVRSNQNGPEPTVARSR